MPIIWLRRLIRRKFRPVDTDVAVTWKQKLSAMYAFFSMNLFLLVVYKTAINKAEYESTVNSTLDEKQPPGRKWANLLGLKQATVVRISGTDITSYEVKPSDKMITKNELDDDDIV